MKKLLFVLLLFIVNPLFSQRFSDYEYDEDDSTFSLKNLNYLDTVVNSYRVFMTGENHSYTNVNNGIELQMLKYLNEKRGVRNLVIELGFARGYLLNKYINDDTSILDLLLLNTDRRYINSYRNLRKLNQGLPEDKRIHVHGIDVERFPDDAPILMSLILGSDTVVPEKIDFLVEVIHSYAEYCKSGHKYRYRADYSYSGYYSNYYNRTFDDNKVVDSIIAGYDNLKAEFDAYLGDQSVLFEETVRSLKEYLIYMRYFNMPQQYIYRERFMYENMKRLLNKDTNASFYGQFGRCHIGLSKVKNECEWWNHSPLANRLNRSEFKDKVMSIGIYYNDRSYYNYNYYDFSVGDDYQSMKYLDSIGDSKMALVKINDKDSFLKTRFNYLIVTKTSIWNSYTNEKFRSDFTAIDFSYGKSIFNFNQLNAAINPGGNGFDNMITTYGINVSVSSYNLYNVYDIKYFVPQKIKAGNIKYNLQGFSILEGVGYIPYISKRFSFAPYFLFGYSRLTLSVVNDSLSSKISPAFSDYNTSKFANNALSLGLGLDLRYNFAGVFGIFAKGHFVADPSYYNWRRIEGFNNKLDKGSPKTSLLNYGLSAGLSILIMDY